VAFLHEWQACARFARKREHLGASITTMKPPRDTIKKRFNYLGNALYGKKLQTTMEKKMWWNVLVSRLI
jgi:hypothetical protein